MPDFLLLSGLLRLLVVAMTGRRAGRRPGRGRRRSRDGTNDDRLAGRLAEGEPGRERVGAVVGAAEGEYPGGAGGERAGLYPDGVSVAGPAVARHHLVTGDREPERRLRDRDRPGVASRQGTGEPLPVVLLDLVRHLAAGGIGVQRGAYRLAGAGVRGVVRVVVEHRAQQRDQRDARHGQDARGGERAPAGAPGQRAGRRKRAEPAQDRTQPPPARGHAREDPGPVGRRPPGPPGAGPPLRAPPPARPPRPRPPPAPGARAAARRAALPPATVR